MCRRRITRTAPSPMKPFKLQDRNGKLVTTLTDDTFFNGPVGVHGARSRRRGTTPRRQRASAATSRGVTWRPMLAPNAPFNFATINDNTHRCCVCRTLTRPRRPLLRLARREPLVFGLRKGARPRRRRFAQCCEPRQIAIGACGIGVTDGPAWRWRRLRLACHAQVSAGWTVQRPIRSRREQQNRFYSVPLWSGFGRDNPNRY